MKRIHTAWSAIRRTFARLDNGWAPRYDHSTAHRPVQGAPDMTLVRAKEFQRIQGYGGNTGSW